MTAHGLTNDPFLRAAATLDTDHFAPGRPTPPSRTSPSPSPTGEMTTAPIHSPSHQFTVPEQLWSVTMPITTGDGRSGSHTFVVAATTAQAALASAVAGARTDAAKLRRRHATIDTHAAVITLWKG
ncbi:hypothetical protein OG735_01340 [Streptomyces sp. NBC_01210]|uniref:hypothetical protein n=1 Tax=Streptomyces sp. NBC_01210 TaxID=2903774 RepID=UPI002E16844B|nr:hypothetical protein OG735_01340 [Streptomyces sp. NBC_01210]